MARNLNRTQSANIRVPMPVPSGTVSGQVVAIGSDGLVGYAITDRVTQAQLDSKTQTLPQGLRDGQASVELIGVGISVNLQLPAGTAGSRVYVTPGGAYSGTASGNTPIGYRLATSTASGLVPVGLTKG